MSGNKNKKIAFNYLGGKISWIEWLLPKFPDRNVAQHFVDVFGGSLAMGFAAISSYENDLYKKELYKDWNFFRAPVKFNNMRSSQVQECLWTNYEPDKINSILTLFPT